MTPLLRVADGEAVALPVDRWLGAAAPEEEAVLDRVVGPVLDVGCGPARHTLALHRRGIPTLGIDIAAGAVRLATLRGAQVLRRSVFDRVPGEGSWGSVLLLDGNIGIGGDPAALLERLRALLRPGGRALVELEAPGRPTRSLLVRLEHGGTAGPWFPWARVGADRAAVLAREAGFVLVETWQQAGRWFGRMDAVGCTGGPGRGRT